ncbi:MAG: hypothetical protein Q4P33_03135 [Flaviflexus sp.]|nr:hypothetical protein [Flaviflexus sp.]
MVRFSLRIMRTAIISWVAGLIFLLVVYPASFVAQFDDLAERTALVTTSQNSGGINALYGTPQLPGYLGQVTSWEGGTYLLILSGVAAILLASKHMCAEGDELVAPLGGSPADLVRSAAQVGLALAAGLALAMTATMVVINTVWGEFPLEGSLTLSLLIGASFASFFFITMFFGLLTADRKTARQLGFITLALAVVLRAVANSADLDWLSWATPIGWLDIALPFTDDDIRPLLVTAGIILLTGGAARALASSMEFRQQVVGRDRAHGSYRPPGNVLRLLVRDHRASLIIWTVVILGFAAYMASLIQTIVDLLADKPSWATYFGLGEDVFVEFTVFITGFVSILTSCAAVQFISALGAEETSGRLEQLLGAAATRRDILTRVLAATIAFASVLCLATGLITAATVEAVSDQPVLAEGLIIGLSSIPGTVVFIGLGAALLAGRVSWRVGTWVLIAAAAVVTILGRTLSLPDWLVNLSPFEYTGSAGSTHVLAWTILLAITAAAAALALYRYPRRDIA